MHGIPWTAEITIDEGCKPATLQELAERIDQADAVVIGGGYGLSSAAGYDHYHWSPALSEALAPFREQYGFTSPLAGFYYCFSSYGEQWGYYSQYIRFMWEAPTGQPYLDLQALVADKPAFVLTTNVDRQFFRVFPKEQICAFQGDFGYCQCSQPCRDEIWENRELVKELTSRLNPVRTCRRRMCPVAGTVAGCWCPGCGTTPFWRDVPGRRSWTATMLFFGTGCWSRPEKISCCWS